MTIEPLNIEKTLQEATSGYNAMIEALMTKNGMTEEEAKSFIATIAIQRMTLIMRRVNQILKAAK